MWKGVMMGEKVIGILGGMGPEATADLFYRIVRSTDVERDQDHPRTIIYSNSKVPDRTAAILAGGPSPLPEMLKAGRVLESAGADFLIMPCNTAHYFIEELRTSLGIPVLHMIELTARDVKARMPDVGRAGLIATDGTVRSGIYHESFSEVGAEIVVPPPELQTDTMAAIYDHIKAGDLFGGRELLLGVARRLVEHGAEIVLCGCTEVSLVLKDGDLAVPVVDPLQVLAETAVEVALGRADLAEEDLVSRRGRLPP
jgi:aspartate racemase